jgi:hypothetical protein
VLQAFGLPKLLRVQVDWHVVGGLGSPQLGDHAN